MLQRVGPTSSNPISSDTHFVCSHAFHIIWRLRVSCLKLEINEVRCYEVNPAPSPQPVAAWPV